MSEGRGWDCGIRFTGQLELGVIRKTMKIDINFTENSAKRKKVSDENKGSQDRALGGTPEEMGEGQDLKDLS